MNKLVSKNSVLRFKLGNQIKKFKNPDGPILKWTYSGENAFNPLKEIKKLFSNWNFRTGIINSTNQQLLLNTEELVKKAWKKLEEDAMNKRGIYRPKSNIKSSVTTPRFLSKYANMANTIGGASNIKSWLEKLKNYYTPGTYNPDSIWGANTQAAYDRYLADQVKLNVEFSVDNLSNEISNTAGLEKAKEIPSVNQQVVPELPNYSDYINWRDALNLHYTNPFVTYAKQGSKLISRNPIWRFKSVNFRKVAQ